MPSTESPPSAPPPKRVLIVGAGAAGMSCADQLSSSSNNNNNKFKVTLVDAQPYCGGQAFSIPLDPSKFGADWLNQGVQGGSHIFRHTFHMMRKQSHDVTPVQLQISFGDGINFWSNVFPTSMVAKHQSEIKKFSKVLKFIGKLKPLFMLISVEKCLKMFGFSAEFRNYMVMPTLALFLGTGNGTPEVPCIILEQLFRNGTYGIWYPLDEKNLVGNHPPMVVFPRFESFYGDWKKDIETRGVDVRLSTEVTQIVHRDSKGVIVRMKRKQTDNDNSNEGEEEKEEHFDELVLCVLADTALRLLGKTSTWRERFVLAHAKFSDDITVTHCDAEYMRKYYVNDFPQASKYTVSSLSKDGGDEEEEEDEETKKRLDIGKEFSPMYYIRPYTSDPRKLEMGFDCSNYQSQFPRTPNTSPHNASTLSQLPSNQDKSYPLDAKYEHPGLEKSTLPLEQHIFQTIFLNNERDSHLWTKSEINPDKIIREDWWHQLVHSWTHYVFVVPWVWTLNSTVKLWRSSSVTKSTRFAGSWTLVNAHEVAVISGLAAAWSLGGGYPEEEVKRSEEVFMKSLMSGNENNGGEVNGERVSDRKGKQGGRGGGGGGKWKGFATTCFKLYCLLIYGRWYRQKMKKN